LILLSTISKTTLIESGVPEAAISDCGIVFRRGKTVKRKVPATIVTYSREEHHLDWCMMTKMKVVMTVVLVLAGCALMPASDNPSSPGAPVLVELFTSEGCSTCPPADALLQKLDREQPIAGVQVIVLSEHVDYWNHLGWSDPYSSKFFSDRQSDYAQHFSLGSVYTPQMVVDGTAELTGGDSQLAGQAIEKARNQPKISVRILSASTRTPAILSVHVEADPLTGSSARERAEVWLAVALDHAESQVSGGENGGRHLSHVAVVQSLTKAGDLKNGKSLDREVEVKLNPHTDAKNLRVIAFVQQSGPGHVLGAAMQRVGE
jgi:hypothetical protein